MDELSVKDIQAQIYVLQERLVSFYAIQSDVDCEEAKEVLQVQINNYRTSLEALQKKLLAHGAC